MFKLLEEFRYARWVKRLNRTAQIILSLTLVGVLNYLAARHFWRWDLTTDHRYALSAETRSYLRDLPHEAGSPVVTLYLTLPATRTTGPNNEPDPTWKQQTAPLLQELRGLISEYIADAALNPAGQPMIETHDLAVYRDTRIVEELSTKYGLDLKDNTALVVARADPAHNSYVAQALSISDLYEFQPDGSGAPKEFLGEQAVTTAILGVTQPHPPKIYFTTGHGEMQLGDTSARGLSDLKNGLHEHNLAAAELDLTDAGPVPEDAAAVVIASPDKAAFQPSEIEKLRAYLKQSHGTGIDQRYGRLMVLLNPGQHSGLEDFFFEWGLLCDDDLVIERDPNALEEGLLMVNGDRMTDHPITHAIISYQVPVALGPTRSVRLAPAVPDEVLQSLDVKDSLLLSSKNSWGERDYLASPHFDRGVDFVGPESLAAVAEQHLPGLSLPGGRLVVFGNADFIGNKLYGEYGNRFLFLDTVNYLLDREGQLNIPPKAPFHFEVNLTRENRLGLALRLALVPAVLAFLGGLVYFIRQR